MKKALTIITFFVCCYPVGVFAQRYSPVGQNSIVQFNVVNHLIFKSTVTGTLQELKGAIIFDPNNLAKSFFDVTVAVKTINTGIGKRDRDLLKEKYFNEQQYPLIIIKSQSITPGDINGSYVLNGNLTIKGITKTISLPFTARIVNGSYQFKGHFQINRMDFNVGPDNSIDKNIDIELSVTTKPL